MGLESEYIENLLNNGDLFNVKQSLLRAGWQGVNFGFDLGRKNGGIDVQKGHTRILVYPTSEQDRKNYEMLQKHNLPRFDVSFYTTGQSDLVGIASVPRNARALDSMQFPDQEPKTGYLGSYEIMAGIAKLFAKIFKQTSLLPEQLNLSKLALITGSPNIIRHIPPISLKETSEWQILAEQLIQALKIEDPLNNHEGQVKYFVDSFAYFLESKND